MFAGNFGCYSDWHEVPLQSLNLWPLGCKPRSTTIRPQLGSTRITLCIYRMEQPVWLNRVLQLWKTLKPCVRVLACHQWRPLRFRTSDTFSPLCGFVPTARDGAVWWNLQDGVRPGETPPRVKRETEQRTGGHRIVSTALEQNKKKKNKHLICDSGCVHTAASERPSSEASLPMWHRFQAPVTYMWQGYDWWCWEILCQYY